MKTKTFPERVEKLGVSATIYAPKDEAKGFTVAYHVRGKLVRKTRNSHDAAKELAQSVVEQKGNGDLDVLTLNNRDCYMYLRAAEAVKATGRPLDLIAHDYAEAMKLLGNDSLLEAVKFYVANRMVGPAAVTRHATILPGRTATRSWFFRLSLRQQQRPVKFGAANRLLVKPQVWARC